MEGLGLLLVLWIISTVFEKIRDAQRRAPPSEELPRTRRQPRPGRVERPAQRAPEAPSPAASAEEEWRTELERVFGIPVPGQTGPVGRRPDQRLPSAEEEEELTSLESEPELVNIDEVALEQPPRPTYDQDTGAEELVRRRIAAGEARSGGLTRADHARFARMVRAAPQEPAPTDRTAVRARRLSVREAVVWKEILGPPVGLRQPE
jgi:hypothetical protein